MKFSSKICIPIQAQNMKTALVMIKKANKQADIIEIWLDHINDLNLEIIIKNSKKPLLFVNKGKKEKGKWKGSEKQRIELLIEATKISQKKSDSLTPPQEASISTVQQSKSDSPSPPLGVDIGIHTNPKFIKDFLESRGGNGSKLIISFHDFQKTPTTERLHSIVRKAKSLGADIIKIATFARSYKDSLRLLSLLEYEKEKGQEMIVLGMGEAGKLTRLAGCYLGNYLTFAPLDTKTSSASGQITISNLQKLRKLL